jgi:hypothetical protein
LPLTDRILSAAPRKRVTLDEDVDELPAGDLLFVGRSERSTIDVWRPGAWVRGVWAGHVRARATGRFDAILLRLSARGRVAPGVAQPKTPAKAGWAIQDSNLGPLPYQEEA